MNFLLGTIMTKLGCWNKSNLLLKIQNQNTQTLQLFSMIIKMESIYKSNLNGKIIGLGAVTKWPN